MPIRQAFTKSAKLAFLNGNHQPDHTYMVALYARGANLGTNTKFYTPDGEISGPGYETGGKETDRSSGMAGDSAFLSFDDVVWENATLTARGALIYNASAPGKPAIAVLDFGKNFISTAGRFAVQMPPAGPEAVVRII